LEIAQQFTELAAVKEVVAHIKGGETSLRGSSTNPGVHRVQRGAAIDWWRAAFIPLRAVRCAARGRRQSISIIGANDLAESITMRSSAAGGQQSNTTDFQRSDYPLARQGLVVTSPGKVTSTATRDRVPCSRRVYMNYGASAGPNGERSANRARKWASGARKESTITSPRRMTDHADQPDALAAWRP